MRILITTGIFPPDIGGPATYVPQMAKGLARRGHGITVLTLSDRLRGNPRPRRGRGVGEGDSPDSGYPFRVIRVPRRIFKPWRWLRTVFAIVRLGRSAEVLFVNGLAMEATLANLLLRKPTVQKVVGDWAWERAASRGWTSDDFESFQSTPDRPPAAGRRPPITRHAPCAMRHALQTRALKSARSWWTRRADRIIVPSRYLASWVRGWGVPEDRITVIYNAVEPANGIRPAQVPLQTPIKLVTVGRLVPWKRVDQIIEAVAKIDQAGLVVVGDGPERRRLEEHASRVGTADRVFFAGQRAKGDALALTAACDVFVLNSTYEGLPHVVLEAMSLGLPVVATAVGGTPEVVQDGANGRLMPALDGHALHQALSDVVASPAIRRRLAEGALSTAGRFGVQRMVDEAEAVLDGARSTDR